MSFNNCNNNNNNNNKSINVPFCKVCKDAGKTPDEYNTHWVKTLEGEVCCPTLLSQSCRYCHQSGHTVKFCKVIEKEKYVEQRNSNVQKYVESKIVTKTKTSTVSTNTFALLYSSDSDDEKPKHKKRKTTKRTTEAVVQVPTPVVKNANAVTQNVVSYASILSKSMIIEPNYHIPILETLELNIAIAQSKQEPAAQTSFPSYLIGKKCSIIKNWSDENDSDEE